MTSQTPPTSPESLPKYLREGMEKQDTDTLQDAREFIDELIEYNEGSIGESDLPDGAEPVDEDSNGKGTIVKEKVKCGDESCQCADADGEKHGPYLYRYFRDEKGTLTSEYVGKP